ncbi:type I 3-dehydroquinate dehydratase [Akkermansiaceae bacterium]|nr:type I 3-dehydroquinate dehydratase [Akkermansiaceae bacterium]MDB4286541.1 type I 3-dehydroquinate dehydratase [bacterium]MDA7917182.1 type I 3-dehydroquinate dehydratase [Akkermansiaceae bacterium]MDA8967182.1 type I 3-dehydroquinate dehydratase [Akkermansiaceae bacterium]MDB4283412.1 type I 3-dehydroquinate dehydratase [Akkermansiaceae bacterium]
MMKGKGLNLGRALVVGAIADAAALSLVPKDCDIIELRLDSLGFGREMIRYAKKCNSPLLVTARGPEEGGAHAMTISERRKAYEALMPYATAIDIELRSFGDLADVIALAKKEGVTVVGSFHDFEKTPPLEDLESKIGEVADIHKFATFVKTEKDLRIHRTLLESVKNLSVMGMGPLGGEARPEMMKMGSLLNYGYLGETPTAPNQWPVAKLKELAL